MNQLKVRSISNLNEFNIGKIFDNSIMDSISKSFGARFGTGLSSRQGIVQDLNRNVMLGTLSHIRRLRQILYHLDQRQLVRVSYIILNGDLFVQLKVLMVEMLV